VSAPSADGRLELAGASATALAVVVQSLLLAGRYPSAHLDADLLSYLVYYRQLATGDRIPFGYTVPKVLPVLLLGPLGDPHRAMLATVAVAALGGALLFLLAARSLGLAVALLTGVLYVFDPLRSVLTLRSSVDLYMGVALIAAMLALRQRRIGFAAAAILVAALGKPVAVPCALAILLVPGIAPRRRAWFAALPLLALPATAALGSALAGQGVLDALVHPRLPDQHERFVRVAQASPLGVGETLHLVFVEWFGGTLFARTWPLVAVGIALCALSSWRARREPEGAPDRGHPHGARTIGLPVAAVPALLAAGYLAVSLVQPMVVFTRFFWIVTVVLGLMAAYGVVALSRAVPGSRVAGAAVAATLVAALLADRWDDHRWRAQFMLVPFEEYAAVADGAVDAIAHDVACAGPAVVPLAYLPLAVWRAPDKLARGELCAAEDWVDGLGCGAPNCVLFIPDALNRDRTRTAVAELVRGGTILGGGHGSGALVRSRHT